MAKTLLPKDIPVLCRREDVPVISKAGFTRVTGIEERSEWLGFLCESSVGYHGGHLFRKKLGISSSFAIHGSGTVVYLTGDTLYTSCVKKRLKTLNPDYIIANGGRATKRILGKLTMSHTDLMRAARQNPRTVILAVHMDALNHCRDTRDTLKKRIGSGAYGNLLVPGDGEILALE